MANKHNDILLNSLRKAPKPYKESDTIQRFKHSPSKKNAVGYCKNVNHQGLISESQLKDHECLSKHCSYLVKYTKHPFWVRRDLIDLIKKYKKNNRTGAIMIGSKLYKGDDLCYYMIVCENYIKEYGRRPRLRYLTASEVQEWESKHSVLSI